MTMYEKFCQMDIDSRWIGLEKSDLNTEYFCTPVNSRIIGWENNIHYCFIDGYGKMIFAVNPESCANIYVYPLAENFADFLRLILSCGSTTAIEQIICWSKEQFDRFIKSNDNAIFQEQQKVLDKIKESLQLTPMDNPYEYVKSIQNQFKGHSEKIIYSNEYYDTLGLERPDGNEADLNLFEFPPLSFSFIKKDK